MRPVDLQGVISRASEIAAQERLARDEAARIRRERAQEARAQRQIRQKEKVSFQLETYDRKGKQRISGSRELDERR